MMTLRGASRLFDRTAIHDAYSGVLLFKGQVDPYDDSKRDAMVAYRRVLSVDPAIAIPAHRCISVFDKVWIVAGERETDGLTQAHRTKYVLQAADGFINIGSLTDFLTNKPRARVYGFPAWVKDAKQIEESSDVANQFEVILPKATVVRPRDMLWRDYGTELFIATSARMLPSEFMGVDATRLESADFSSLYHVLGPSLRLDFQANVFSTWETASVQSRVFSTATGGLVDGNPVPVPAIRVRWQSLFKYDSEMSQRYQEGDFALAMPAGTVVNTQSVITFAGIRYAVLDVTNYGDAIVAHVRRTT